MIPADGILAIFAGLTSTLKSLVDLALAKLVGYLIREFHGIWQGSYRPVAPFLAFRLS